MNSCKCMIRHNLYLHKLLCLQGSDIETLGSEAAVEHGVEVLEHPPAGETKLQDTQASICTGKYPLVFLFF